MPTEIKVLEFYCGIGGTHFAMAEVDSCIANVVGAYDINTTTNAIYRHNFPSTKLFQNNIQSLSVPALEAFEADLWTMSPPCQPFTLKGNRLGEEDRRCDSFKVLLSRLEEMNNPPKFIFLENVKGFNGTSAHKSLLQTLYGKGYALEEYLLSPLQFGVPNSRPRYYLLARLCSDVKDVLSTSEVVETIPDHVTPPLPSLSHFITIENVENESFYVDPSTACLSIVTPSSTSTACFTKSYGQCLVGCGSYLEMNGRVRRFTPREISSLMTFPSNFSWPSSITTKQLYRALGNSINVRVVSFLLSRLLSSHT